METRDRILDAALASFGTRGYAKGVLLDAVIDRSAGELAEALESALAKAGPGFARVEALVRSVFRLANRRPELLGLLREVGRLGPPAASRLTDALDPLLARATAWLEAEMVAGNVSQKS